MEKILSPEADLAGKLLSSIIEEQNSGEHLIFLTFFVLVFISFQPLAGDNVSWLSSVMFGTFVHLPMERETKQKGYKSSFILNSHSAASSFCLLDDFSSFILETCLTCNMNRCHTLLKSGLNYLFVIL